MSYFTINYDIPMTPGVPIDLNNYVMEFRTFSSITLTLNGAPATHDDRVEEIFSLAQEGDIKGFCTVAEKWTDIRHCDLGRIQRMDGWNKLECHDEYYKMAQILEESIGRRNRWLKGRIIRAAKRSVKKRQAKYENAIRTSDANIASSGYSQ